MSISQNVMARGAWSTCSEALERAGVSVHDLGIVTQDVDHRVHLQFFHRGKLVEKFPFGWFYNGSGEVYFHRRCAEALRKCADAIDEPAVSLKVMAVAAEMEARHGATKAD